ncbi:GAF domain-containing protein [Persicobacter psychrovividus]|uniref:PAS domain-containing protein n=1 Tax=Persicobacter psychrovividus TaxID=387638 RepID=A0ABN6L754_9BACT|nr:hypothetical protein PEPS_12860 [Persicobacter psychrovividus]
MIFSTFFNGERHQHLDGHQRNNLHATVITSCNMLALAATCMTFLFYGHSQHLWLPGLEMLVAFTCLALAWRGAAQSAANVLVFGTAINIMLISIADTALGQSPRLPIILMQIVAVILPFVIFSLKNKAQLVGSVAFTLVCFLPPYFTPEFIDPEGHILGVSGSFFYKVFSAGTALNIFFLVGLMEFFAHKQRQNNGKLVSEMEEKQTTLAVQSKEMKDYLEEIEKQKKEDEHRQWIISGISEVDALLRSNLQDQEMLDALVHEVVKYTGSVQGGLYLVEQKEGKDLLRLSAAYAYDRKKFIDGEIQIGEGLIGQCYLEREPIFLTDVPNDYVKITSGLGEANPRCIAILPMIYNEEIVAVFESAAFNVLNKYQMEYLKAVSSSIAAYLVNRKVAARTNILLKESQLATEQLRAQEEEMRQNMEELHATHEQMTRMQDEQKSQHDRMLNEQKQHANVFTKIFNEVPNKLFMKDDECRMIMVNEAVCKAHNCTAEDLLGKSDLDFFGEKTGTPMVEEEKEIMRTGMREYRQTELSEIAGGKTKYLRTIKMPFYIDYLGKTGLLGIQFDETEKYENEDRIRQLEEELMKLKSATNAAAK